MAAMPVATAILPAEGRAIRIRGLVQGVGFRPTVWRLARDCGLAGDVSNDAEGVLIRAWGRPADLDRFLRRLEEKPPPLARIDSVTWALTGDSPIDVGFHIVSSRGGEVHTAVGPDAATCYACLGETLDPSDRRYNYPFTNCTHCGPRLSIVRAVPYDRCNTSMAEFPLCPACRAEYVDPEDRRFHAQPAACPSCGPHAWLERFVDGRTEPQLFAACDAAEAARALLLSGAIIAIKGLGGFHLACDACNEDAVAKLRGRKRRYSKPFALMARDLDVIRRYCAVAENGARAKRYRILRQAARDMGVVVLDLLNPASVRHRPLPAEFGGEIIGMHIDSDRLGRVIVQRQIKREGFLVARESGRVLQVTNVLGEDCLPVFQEAERALEFPAKSEQRTGVLETRGQSDRRRCISAGAAEEARLAEHDPHHGIVQPVHDVAIMEEPIIGNGGQKARCFLIVSALWLLREIAAGHDKRPLNVPQQQMVQWRIGQHESESRKSRGHRLGHAIGAGGSQNHYRGSHTLEQRLLLTVDGAISADDV
jgi:acylphosphatase